MSKPHAKPNTRPCTGPRPRRSRAFSLLDVMIALVVAGLLVAVALPTYSAIHERVRVSRAITDLSQIQQVIDRHWLRNDHTFPASLAEIGMAMTDPWGNPYHYLNIAGGAKIGQVRKDRNLVPLNSDYDLYSAGKDGDSVAPLTAKASRDDIVRANNGAFLGLAEDY